ncbi:MAG: zinc-ribbon domain-containing protein [Deltaproteobacteria bacterium]|nr:zinc-ribbon domain-containing protein [Deltaproteobacteria bacterium]
MNINCPGCDFEYKLDERRIPAGGQKMRCPKCRTSFRITKEGVAPETPADANTTAYRSSSPSMPPVLGRPSAPPKSPAEIDDPFAETDMAPRNTASDLWGDPFADRKTGAPAQNLRSSSLTSSDEASLPALKHGITDLPAPADPVDLPVPRDVVDLPTPAVLVDLPTTQRISDLPAPRTDIDLPAVRGVSDLPALSEFSDLPALSDFSDLPEPIAISPERDRFALSTDEPLEDVATREPLDDFGDIGIELDDDELEESESIAMPPGKNPVASNFSGRPVLDTGDFDLPPSTDNLLEEGDIEESIDVFRQPVAPPLAQSATKTTTGAGGSIAPRHSGASLPSIDPDDFEIPSPADLTSEVPDARDSSEDVFGFPAEGGGLEDFGNIDLQGDITGTHPMTGRPSVSAAAGSIDFGQLDFGEDSGEEPDEFDAFPVQDEEKDASPRPSRRSTDSLDLDDMPAVRGTLDDSAFGGFSATPLNNQSDVQASSAQSKKKAAFEGRRKYERQTRRTKIIIMLLLLALAAGGAGLHFTPLGLFGVNYLVSLLPSATTDEVVRSAFDGAMKSVDKDTYHSIANAIHELEIKRNELQQNEDLRIIGVYLNDWYQLRFGISSDHEKSALSLLKNINLEQSESQYAPIARYSRLILTEKSKSVIDALSNKPTLSSNESALLVMAYLKSNNPQGALDSARKGIRKRATPRFEYLTALAAARLNNTDLARSTLDALIQTAPEHFDARLLMARILVAQKEKDTPKVTELLNPVNEADDTRASMAQKASVHAIMGQMLLQLRKTEDAKKEFAKATKLNPDDALAQTGQGSIALMSSDLPGAVTAFKRALQLEPENIDAQLGVAETLIRQNKASEARVTIEPIVQKHPGNEKAHYLSGAIAQNVKQYESAMASYKKAIELNPDYIEAYVALASIYAETNRKEEAMKTLDDAAKAVPGSALIKLTLADGHAENEDYASAIVNLNEALEIEPDNPIVHFKMAQMYRKMEELQDAQNALDEVFRIDPNFPGLSVEQGYVLELSGKIDDALKRYEDALKRNPDDLSAKTRVAAASIYQNNLDRAKELLVDVLNENPESPDGNFYMGEVFRLEDSSADAIPYLKKATELDTANPIYFVRYGAALFRLNDIGKAIQQYTKALELDPKMAETYLRMGELKLRSGSIQTAIDNFAKALELNPQIEDAYIFTGQAYEEIADLKSAAANYQKATKAFPKNPEGFYRLGKTWLQTKGNKGGIGPLEEAVKLAQTQNNKPYWLTDAYYYLGISQKSIGNSKGAIASFRKYLEIAPEDAIDRAEVKAALDDLLY